MTKVSEKLKTEVPRGTRFRNRFGRSTADRINVQPTLAGTSLHEIASQVALHLLAARSLAAVLVSLPRQFCSGGVQVVETLAAKPKVFDPNHESRRA